MVSRPNLASPFALALLVLFALPAWPQSGALYGPVTAGETLWGIANTLRSRGITVQQSMVAIYDENRAAFDGNMFQIKQGATLRVPSYDAMRRIPKRIAMQEAERQRLLEEKGRRDSRPPHSLATMPRNAPASRPASPVAPARPEAARDDNDRPLPPLTAERLLAPQDALRARPPSAGPDLASLSPRDGGLVARSLRGISDELSDFKDWLASWLFNAGTEAGADVPVPGNAAAPDWGSTEATPDWGSTEAAPGWGSTEAAPDWGSTEAAPDWGGTAVKSDWRRVAREPEVLFGALAVIVVVTLLGLLAAPPRRRRAAPASRAMHRLDDGDGDADDPDRMATDEYPDRMAADERPDRLDPNEKQGRETRDDFGRSGVAELPLRVDEPPPRPAMPAPERDEQAAGAYWSGDSVPASWQIESEGEAAADADMARRHRLIDKQLDLVSAYLEVGRARSAHTLLDEVSQDPACTQSQRDRIARMLGDAHAG